VRILSSR
ncbi:hypothetical protein EC82524_0906B, partial [Escherichia coli 8.2524]